MFHYPECQRRLPGDLWEWGMGRSLVLILENQENSSSLVFDITHHRVYLTDFASSFQFAWHFISRIQK